MNPIRVPTDNLYKFLAITGLILMVASCVMPMYFAYQADLQRARFLAHADYMKWIEDLKGLGDREFVGSGLCLKALDDFENLKRYVEENKYATKTVEELVPVCFWLFVFSALLTAVGFLLWYLKLQRHQDKILRRQAQEQAS